MKIIICAGTGGVGKTTVSASLGLCFAHQGKKVLVLTLDPARRLISALGLDSSDEEIRVDLKTKGELWASMIDPAKIFDRFIHRVSTSETQAQKLLKNPLYFQLSRSLNGSQEFTSLERLLEAWESKKYNLIILDTPPSQHAVDFLKAPEQIFSLFQDSITKWFIQKNGGLLNSIFHRGTQAVLSALERITGSQFVGELSDFFASMSDMQQVVASRSIRVHQLLTQAETSFLLVTGYDEAKLREAQMFAKEIRRGGYKLGGVVINRSFPEEQKSSGLPKENKEFYQNVKNYFAHKIKLCDDFARELKLPVTRLPDFTKSIQGLDGIKMIAEELKSSNIMEKL